MATSFASSKAGDCVSLSVIMPAYNAEALLPQVLPPLLELLRNGKVLEVVVVDDRSTDRTADVAEEMSARIFVTPENGGPGAARNLAAESSNGDILWFVDADVVAEHGCADRILTAFKDEKVGAVFGSYDDDPASRHWFSTYRNLLHHFHHQKGNRDASTFWAGCGAVRKEVFLEVGGFDTDTYQVPSIEDIELGYRITGAGYRIVLDPQMQCKHLKHWTVANAIKTDIFRRALPWSRLMIAREGITNDLNASTTERFKAVLAAIFLLSLAALPFAPAIWPVSLVATIAVFAANWPLFRLFLSRGGLPMAIASILYHQIFYLYSATVFVWCLFEFHVLGRRDNLGVHK